MQSSSLSEFLDSFERPTPFRLVFWVLSKKGSSSKPKLIRRSITCEGEDGTLNVGVHVKSLFSSSAVNESVAPVRESPLPPPEVGGRQKDGESGASDIEKEDSEQVLGASIAAEPKLGSQGLTIEQKQESATESNSAIANTSNKPQVNDNGTELADTDTAGSTKSELDKSIEGSHHQPDEELIRIEHAIEKVDAEFSLALTFDTHSQESWQGTEDTKKSMPGTPPFESSRLSPGHDMDAPPTLFIPLSSPGSSVGDRSSLAPHYEELPMLLLTELQKEDAGEVAIALETLSNLLDDSRWDSRHTAQRLGAHSIVVLALRRFKESEEVQTWGCCCLGLLSLGHPETTLAITQLGGMEGIVNAISRFSNSLSVQRHGCDALARIFSCIQPQMEMSRLGFQGDDMQVAIAEEEGMTIYDRFVHEMDGIRLLLRSMKNYSGVIRILSPCCRIFSILAELSDDHRTALKDAGVISVVALALEHNLNDVEMTRYANEFMVKMFST